MKVIIIISISMLFVFCWRFTYSSVYVVCVWSDFVPGLHVLHPAVHVHARQHRTQPARHVQPEVPGPAPPATGLRAAGHEPAR